MYPALLVTNPEIALGSILQYRVNLAAGASRKARSYHAGYEGYMFPWESAYTGQEACPYNATGWNISTGMIEQHVTGDVAFAFKQYWQLTNDTAWLDQSTHYPTYSYYDVSYLLIDWYIILGIAKFWASRVTFNNATQAYEINGVIPPDEFVYNVNNSGIFYLST